MEEAKRVPKPYSVRCLNKATKTVFERGYYTEYAMMKYVNRTQYSKKVTILSYGQNEDYYGAY